jgi:Cu/Ag efflux pump CusA
MWSGHYEYLERATARFKIVVPMTLLIIFLLLYLNFRPITETMIVMLSLPFALARDVLQTIPTKPGINVPVQETSPREIHQELASRIHEAANAIQFLRINSAGDIVASLQKIATASKRSTRIKHRPR